jgi:hypothetical protein
MRGRIRKLAPSTRNPVGWRNGGQSRAPKEQPLALDGTSFPKVRVASAVESVDVSELRPPWRNARIHSNKQIRQIANSIRQFGWTSPIVTDENKQIIAGFGRFKAAEQLGLRKVPVIVVTGLNEVQKRALALAETKLRRPRPGIVPFSLPNWASSPFYFPNTILASISPASSQQRSTL